MIKPVKITKLEQIVSELANVHIDALAGRQRDQATSDARMFVWFVIYKAMGHTYSYIARQYDRDHTTIIHAVRKMEKSEKAKKLLDKIKEINPEMAKRELKGTPKTLEFWKI